MQKWVFYTFSSLNFDRPIPSRHHLKAQLDPQNAGVLVVMIEGASGQRGIGADEISRRLERDDEGCTIM